MRKTALIVIAALIAAVALPGIASAKGRMAAKDPNAAGVAFVSALLAQPFVALKAMATPPRKG